MENFILQYNYLLISGFVFMSSISCLRIINMHILLTILVLTYYRHIRFPYFYGSILAISHEAFSKIHVEENRKHRMCHLA